MASRDADAWTDHGWLAPGESRLEAMAAYEAIAATGIRGRVVVHPACDEITLRDGRVLKHWEGGDMFPRHWTVTAAS